MAGRTVGLVERVMSAKKKTGATRGYFFMASDTLSGGKAEGEALVDQLARVVRKKKTVARRFGSQS